MLGASFADPDHAAAHGVQRVLVQDYFDNLSPPQMEPAPHPEPVFRGIENKTGQPFLISVEVDYQTGARRFGEDALGAADLREQERASFGPV